MFGTVIDGKKLQQVGAIGRDRVFWLWINAHALPVNWVERSRMWGGNCRRHEYERATKRGGRVACERGNRRLREAQHLVAGWAEQTVDALGNMVYTTQAMAKVGRVAAFLMCGLISEVEMKLHQLRECP